MVLIIVGVKLFLYSATNLLANFSILITYENFITFGLIAAVPASAGKKGG